MIDGSRRATQPSRGQMRQELPIFSAGSGPGGVAEINIAAWRISGPPNPSGKDGAQKARMR